MREAPNAASVALGVLSAAAAGAVLAYLLDPDEGGHRRTRVRAGLGRVAERAADGAPGDLGHRARGVVAELRGRFTGGTVSDAVLADRVCARIDAVLGRGSAVRGTVTNGRVGLTGPVLADDVDRLVRRIAAVRGVAGVDNQLEVYTEPGNIPGLQGPRPARRPAEVFKIARARWAPTLGSLAALASATAALVFVSSVARKG